MFGARRGSWSGRKMPAIRSSPRDSIPSVSRRSTARRLVSSLSVSCRIGRIFRSWSGVRFISVRHRSGVSLNQRNGSRWLRISSLAEPITRNAPVTAPATKLARTRKAIFHLPAEFMLKQNKFEPGPKAIFFDAMGTLFYLTHNVGYHYAMVGQRARIEARSGRTGSSFHSGLALNAGRGSGNSGTARRRRQRLVARNR